MQLAGAVGQGHPSKMWPAVPGQGAPSFGRPQGDRATSLVAARVTFRGLAMAGGRRRTGSPKNVGRRTGGRVTPRLVSPLRARRLPGRQLRRFGRSREPRGAVCLSLAAVVHLRTAAGGSDGGGGGGGEVSVGSMALPAGVAGPLDGREA